MVKKKNKRKKACEYLEIIEIHPPASHTRDADHAAQSASTGQRLRTKHELEHDIRIKTIESNERIEAIRNKRIIVRYVFIFIISMTSITLTCPF